MAGKKQNYSEELRKNGKTANEIVKEYQIARSTILKWVSDDNNNGLFKAKVENGVNRKFNQREDLKIIISNLS